MFRAFWLLIKIGFLVGLVLWIAERPGLITINWLDYTLKIQVGFFLLLMLGFVIIGILVFSLIKSVLDFPDTMARYKAHRNRVRGLRALTLGMTAVAAGDGKGAEYQAKRAREYLSDQEPLPMMLAAQAARLQGDEGKAALIFKDLVQHKDASFLGVRGLLHTALESGDYDGALELGRRALRSHPRQGWIVKVVYDLEIRLRNWNSADKVLIQAEKIGVINRDGARHDRVAMILAQALEARADNNDAAYRKLLLRAHRIDKRFVPTVVFLGRLYLSRGNRRASIAMIADSWRFSPHPDLVELWAESAAVVKEDSGLARIKWFERLLAIKPDSVEGLQALALVLMQEGLWGEARKHLEKAETIRPNVNLYKLWARLEERATGDQRAVRGWLEKAADAPRERVWICSETGRIYEEWSPVSDQGLFNTIIWDFPQGRTVGESLLARGQRSVALLDII